jgi:putative ABC transport system substrate-binding protein
MKRREFITLLGGAAVLWPLGVGAQQPERMRRIGVLMGVGDAEGQLRVSILRRGLQELGWVEGDNITIEVRLAGGDVSRMRADAAEVASMGPDVIVATNAALLDALRQANSSVPVVFVLVANVIESGMVASQARPGANITGFTNFEPAIAGKWLEALKEIAPHVKRVGVIYSPETTLYALSMRHIEAAGASLGVTPSAIPIRDATDIERAAAALARESNGGLIVMPAPIVSVHRDQIFAQAARHQLPAIYPYRIYPEAGGLISYGIDVRDLFRQTASYVDRILRGANPADLPIQVPTKYELVINLKTAKALGLEVPPTLLARADEVIE